MRVGYLVMGLGLAVVEWPVVIGHDGSTPLFEAIVAVTLIAVSLLAFLDCGIRFDCCRSCSSSARGSSSGWASWRCPRWPPVTWATPCDR
jgi:hypothetical protein